MWIDRRKPNYPAHYHHLDADSVRDAQDNRSSIGTTKRYNINIGESYPVNDLLNGVYTEGDKVNFLIAVGCPGGGNRCESAKGKLVLEFDFDTNLEEAENSLKQMLSDLSYKDR